jgi:signal transduction histidine kinase
MLDGLKIAIRKQKKLILLFLLTVFIPSAALSIFGLIALRNEQYRIEKQVEEDQVRTAELFKAQIRSKFSEIEFTLQNLATTSPLIDRDYQAAENSLMNQMLVNPLLEQFFVVYGDSELWFPPVNNTSLIIQSITTPSLDRNQSDKLREAEQDEFIEGKYKDAISAYKTLIELTRDKNTQAQYLNHIARNQVKLSETDQAINTYLKIISDYPGSITSSGIPLSISAQIELISCHQKNGNNDAARQSAINAFNDVLKNWGKLSTDQFNSYFVNIQETYSNLILAYSNNNPKKVTYQNEFENLGKQYQETITRLQVINKIKTECLPDISREILLQNSFTDQIFRYFKTIDKNDYLILYSFIPDKNQTSNLGILAVKINSSSLENNLLKEIIRDSNAGEKSRIIVANLNSRIIYENNKGTNNPTITTSFFENNFPPWKIEIMSAEKSDRILSGIYKSFYFWTIITMIFLLIVGVMMIGRTLSHEMDIIKIKSEFISSVSHEFKTPITSIKGLTERLSEGKVKDPVRLKEYYSVIAHDADYLGRLVTNFLDFAKIEEGRDQYNFEETDIKKWLETEVESFRKGIIGKEINISIHIPTDIPLLHIDQRHLSLVINNLIDNAIKFSAGKIEIKIIAEEINNNILLKVIDNGIGIPKNELLKIFEKFYQGNNAAGLSATGTGLGLTLVKRIMEAHNGTVTVESEPGMGSTFILTLPVK